MAAVELIPPAGEREWLLDGLRDLVVKCGHEHLVSTPVVLPNPRCFPDPWSPDAGGVRRLALRIMRYAALDELDVVIQMFGDEEPEEDLQPGREAWGQPRSHEGAAAWFAGIVEHTCLFGADVSLLDDPGGVTAALAHETAHAFREVHGLAVQERDMEECLTDLSTIYLGFGVLTANASLRHRSWGTGSEGSSLGGHAWSTQHLGYLSPQAMCFGLAVFERVRQRGPAERRAIVDALEANQAGFFKAARRWLARELPDVAALRERLGLPDPSGWPLPVLVDDLLSAPLEERGADDGDDDGDGDTDPSAAAMSVDRDWNVDGEVWRVPCSGAVPFGGLILLLTVTASLTLFLTGYPWIGGAACMAGAVVNGMLSRRVVRYECSTCQGFVRLEDERCALCGGTVMGTLARAEDRLELPNPRDADDGHAPE